MKHFLLSILTIVSYVATAQTRHFTVKDGLLNNQVRQLVSMPNHQMMVVTEGAFFLFNGHQFVELPCRQDSVMALPVFGCHDYMWQGDSVLWLKDFYNLYKYNTQKHRFCYDYSHISQNSIANMFMHADVDSTTSVKREILGKKQAELHNFTSDYHLFAYAKDWQGGEWYGLESDGIIYRRPSPPLAHTIQLPDGDEPRFVKAITTNELLVSSTHGVYKFNTTDQTFTPISFGTNDCTNMRLDAQGGMWIASMQGIVYYKEGKSTLYSSGNTTGFLHSHMRFVAPVQNGKLLVCNMLHHLGYFDTETKHFNCLNDQLPQLNNYRVMIDALPFDNKGNILVITQNGQFLLNTHTNKISTVPQTESIARFTTKYNCALRDSKGCIWLGTQNGLFWLVPQLTNNGQVEGYILHRTTTQDGLSNNCIQDIVEDANGNIWVGTSYGINCIRCSKEQLHIIPLLQTDGVPTVEMRERGACATADGKVYFASSAGLTIIDSHEMKESREKFHIHHLMLKIRSALQPTGLETYELAYNDFPLEMEFSALNYASPEHTSYRYRMTGLHDDWHYDTSGEGLTSAVFNTLAPGKYTFEIQATLDNGEWGPMTTCQFIVSPPWWATWWAIALYIILGVTIAAYAISRYLRYRRQQLEKENEVRVNKFFELQSEAHYNFAQNVQMEAKVLEGQDKQPQLAERMTKCIADNMDNVDYTVESLARDLAMSRASLYKKVQEELGITPSDFMRNIRLKHSIHLLEQGIPVNQVALMIGFQTPYYFSKCFKKMFGVNPSQFHEKSL